VTSDDVYELLRAADKVDEEIKYLTRKRLRIMRRIDQLLQPTLFPEETPDQEKEIES
jgi:hypothetical protein